MRRSALNVWSSMKHVIITQQRQLTKRASSAHGILLLVEVNACFRNTVQAFLNEKIRKVAF